MRPFLSEITDNWVEYTDKQVHNSNSIIRIYQDRDASYFGVNSSIRRTQVDLWMEEIFELISGG
jgi:hypothetical protein